MDYKDKYFERYEYKCEKKKMPSWSLLGMMDPRRSRNSNNRQSDRKDFSRRESTRQLNNNKDIRDNNTHNGRKDFGTRPSSEQNNFKGLLHEW